MATEAQIRASKKWNEKNSRIFSISLKVGADDKAIEWLDSKPNKSAYIKSLIQKDMETNCHN